MSNAASWIQEVMEEYLQRKTSCFRTLQQTSFKYQIVQPFFLLPVPPPTLIPEFQWKPNYPNRERGSGTCERFEPVKVLLGLGPSLCCRIPFGLFVGFQRKKAAFADVYYTERCKKERQWGRDICTCLQARRSESKGTSKKI